MLAAITSWIELGPTLNVANEAFGGLGKAGLITIIIVSIIAIVTLVWIFRETRWRE